MPRVIDIKPKDIYILMEISLEELKDLQTVMNLSTINFDGKNPNEVKATKYYKEKFFDFVSTTLEEIKHGT